MNLILSTHSPAVHEIPGCVGKNPPHTGMTGWGEPVAEARVKRGPQ